MLNHPTLRMKLIINPVDSITITTIVLQTFVPPTRNILAVPTKAASVRNARKTLNWLSWTATRRGWYFTCTTTTEVWLLKEIRWANFNSSRGSKYINLRSIQPGFPPAVRMGALQWDDELAYLAELNAMSCEIEHDKCRNTRSYAFAGQNLAMGWLLSEKDGHTIDWAIRNFTGEWYIEYKDANPSIVDSFFRPSGPAIGHFTLMTNDKQSKGKFRFDYFVCDQKLINLLLMIST